MTSACGLTEAPSTSATCALIAPVVRPFTYSDNTISLTPVSRRWRLRTIRARARRQGRAGRRSGLPTRLGQPSANTVFEALLPSQPDQFLGRQLLGRGSGF